ncbi:MAG: hypothetical protein HY246_02080 [Proteobacteria bacterium]|nr:hypothetical protein [Pseudomonadota bacterium]
MPNPTVDIMSTGRGGSIYYREGGNTAVFDWEFAASPTIAVIFGPTAQVWDLRYPWAAGRQAEIFDFVGADVVRQKASDAGFDVDLDGGTISLIANLYVVRSPAFDRFVASIVPISGQWRDDEMYDVAAIHDMTVGERRLLIDLLTGRDMTWREVEALAVIDTPAARAAVDAASKHHLSIDTRLAAAEVMHRQGCMPDLDAFLARQLRNLAYPANGLTRALRLAERHPTAAVKQALLWASYNCTECAPHCANLLLSLAGVGKDRSDVDLQPLLIKLGMHNSSFDRDAAFAELCRLVAMQLDPSAGD